MHNRVSPSLDKYDLTHHLMEVNIEVQRKYLRKPHVAQDGDGVPQNKDKYHYRVEIKTAS